MNKPYLMTVQIRWKYSDSDIVHGCCKVFQFKSLDDINRKVIEIIKADSCYEKIEYCYWFNSSMIKTYILKRR